MNEVLEIILTILATLSVFFIIIGGGLFGMHSAEIDYDENCMREMAIKHCESNDIYFHSYSAGSLDSEYFYCIEFERGSIKKRFLYSGQEKDTCRNKDAHSTKYYESKYSSNLKKTNGSSDE